MEPVSTISSVSEKHLWQAEALLQELADLYSKIQISDNPLMDKQRVRLVTILRQDMLEQRNQADLKIKHSERLIGDLKVHLQSLTEELATEICSLTGKEEDRKQTVDQAFSWKQKEEEKLDGVNYDCEHQLAQFSGDLDNYTLQLNHVQSELHSSAYELTQLIKEDERLSSVDRSADIQTEIHALEDQIVVLLKKAATITRVPYSNAFNLNNTISETEAELKQINAKLEMVSEPLDKPEFQNYAKQPGAAKGKGKINIKKASELELLVDRVKNAVKDKRARLRQLYRLRVELGKLAQLEKTARLDLEGEIKRIEKQKARTVLISNLKTKQEYRKQNLSLVQDKISEVENNIETLRQTQQKIQKRKRFFSQKIETIETLKQNLEKCSSQLEREQAKLVLIVPSSTIWFESIKDRIEVVRRRISFGNLFRLLFLPFSCYIRYQLGLLIRKDLIKTERSLNRLGFLSEEYLEQIDIFNRRNKKGQQLCLDILAC